MGAQGAIHFEEGVAGPDRVQRVLGLYTQVVRAAAPAGLPDAEREELSARSVTFADLNADAATLEQAAAAHAALVRSLAPAKPAAAADSKKRPAETGASHAAGALLPDFMRQASISESMFVVCLPAPPPVGLPSQISK